MPRRNYSNVAIPTSLTAGVDASVTTIPVASTAGYPATPFTVGMERGTVNEEVILVAGKTATTLTGVTRGYDSTAARSHSSGAAVEHCVAAIDFDEANAFINSNPFPIGVIADFAGTSSPAGFLTCDGAAVSRTTYAALFAITGTAFGVGNGSTTFNLPDLRGRVTVGLDNMGAGAANRLLRANARGASAGREYVTLVTSEMPVHSHLQTPHTHTQSTHNHTVSSTVASSGVHTHPGGFMKYAMVFFGAQSAGFAPGHLGVFWADATTGGGNHNHVVTNSVGSVAPTIANTTGGNENTGGGAPHENTQPWMAVMKVIKF